MALSGTIWGSFSGTSTSNVRPYIEWSISQGYDGTPYSNVTATLKFVKYNASWGSYNQSFSNTNNIDGSTHTQNNSFDLRPVGTAPIYNTIRSRTIRVNHNSDGTRTCYIGWSGDTKVSLGTFNFGATVTLDTITVATAVTTSSASSVGGTTATVGGTVTEAGVPPCSERGIVWGTSAGSLTNWLSGGSGGGAYSIGMTGLTRGVTYYYAARSYNSSGYRYGSTLSFTTTSDVPSVTTGSVSSVTHNSATLSGTVVTDNGSAITERGFVYSTATNPQIGGAGVTKQTVSGTTGDYSCSASPLLPVTTYYVRAYATNSIGTSYGSQTSFTTLSAAPTVVSTGVTNLLDTTATFGGNVTADNGSAITERGVVYGTSANPTTSNNKVTTSGTTGTYACDVTGLTPATTYHYRAFATNSYGTSYGSDVELRTKPSKPTSFSGNVVSRTQINLAWTKGTGSTYTIIRRATGSYPANPTSGTSVYSGVGTSVNDTSLSAGTKYYYRAWARDGDSNYSPDTTDMTATTHYELTNPGNIYEEDSVYATAPANDNKIYLRASKDGGVTWSAEVSGTLPGTNGVVTFGSSSSIPFGGTWTGDDIDNTSFRLLVTLGSNKTSYQILKDFGFNIDTDYILTGLEIRVKGYFDTDTAYLDGLSLKCYYGTSVLPVKTGAQAYDTTAGRLSLYDGTNWTPMATQEDMFSLVPAGFVLVWAGSSTPSGYLLCNGNAVSRSTYEDLFDAIGTTYGSGDGSTTFNLPNLSSAPAGHYVIKT